MQQMFNPVQPPQPHHRSLVRGVLISLSVLLAVVGGLIAVGIGWFSYGCNKSANAVVSQDAQARAALRGIAINGHAPEVHSLSDKDCVDGRYVLVRATYAFDGSLEVARS
jgi:uncharacterized protein (UPF0333 family)